MSAKPFDFPGKRDGIIASFAHSEASGATVHDTVPETPEDEERTFNKITTMTHLGGAALFPTTGNPDFSKIRPLDPKTDILAGVESMIGEEYVPSTRTTDAALTRLGDVSVKEVQLPEPQEKENE